MVNGGRKLEITRIKSALWSTLRRKPQNVNSLQLFAQFISRRNEKLVKFNIYRCLYIPVIKITRRRALCTALDIALDRKDAGTGESTNFISAVFHTPLA